MLCGRKKLPFAGYSIVKERVVLPADFRLPELLILHVLLARCKRRVRGQTSGEYRARTGDLLVANQALSQLS